MIGWRKSFVAIEFAGSLGAVGATNHPASWCECMSCRPSGCGWIRPPRKYTAGNDLSVLFQRGHSKDHRPDLRQLKVMLAALDPLGVLVGADVVSGNTADDGLYVPMIARLRATLPGQGLAVHWGLQDGGAGNACLRRRRRKMPI
jgi:hypothetical protein